MKLNLNDRATVRLTAYGAGIYNNHMGSNLPGAYRPPAIKAGATLRLSLWELMQIFGASIYMGGAIPFEDNAIDLSEPLSADGSRGVTPPTSLS
ncbi:hypothetical protein N5B55_04895 [Ralstonia pickettii]|uniref:hypothetical protein n=1 Tax=Ralstonia pickettii TaxID=329 RepID=UPI00271476CC|nr:hypothetical protein [Ralstonia pickettii]WKZ86291.1 hypothetical protein N5B55_04895 [Ralstonia pickettii]